MDKKNRQAQLQQYLNNKVGFVYERLMVELLAAQPDNVIDWSIQWLDTKGRDIIMKRTGDIQQDVQEQEQPQAPQPHIHVHYEVSSDEGDEEEEIEELPEQLQQKMKSGVMRSSVSAEVYGKFNKKEDFQARVIPKSEDQKQRIIKRLMQSFMFQALEDKERDIVVDAMEEKKFQPGDWIIKQGEDGDNLYVVDQGELDCYKRFKKDEDEKLLKTYQPGESFGELALLYNAPRAASIQSKNDAILFALDRATFNNIVKDAAVKKREKYEEVLKNIDLLQSMDPYERTHVCDGIKAQKYSAGETIIKQGDKGDKFYMIEEGELIATKLDEGNGQEQTVYEYKAGDYFGELALLKDIPRQANVIAKTDVKLVYLEQQAFKRLLGPVENILSRSTVKYDEYMSNHQ